MIKTERRCVGTDSPIIGALAAGVVGVVIAVLTRLPFSASSKSTAAIIVRNAADVVYLALLFFLSRGKVLVWDALPLLIGGAVGLTLPLIVFAIIDLKSLGKEDKHDG